MQGVLSFFSFILKSIGRFLSWLFVKLGLWVPAVFTLLFLIVAAITGTKFSDVWGIYVFGLCVTIIFAFAITFLSFFRKLGKRERRSESFVTKPKSAKEKKVEFVEGATGDDTPPVINRDSADTAESVRQPELSKENSPYYTPTQFSGYRPVENPAPPKEEFISYNQAPPTSRYRSPLPPQSTSVRINADSGEVPRIYRTRMDASMLIYEYSDRLEFYRNTANGLIKLSVEPKK